MCRLLLAIILLAGFNVKAEQDVALIEAMYIYNFLRYIEWPGTSVGDNFVIGVYGDSNTLDHLIKYTQNRKVGIKTIEVKKVSNLSEAKKCQVLFLPAESVNVIQQLRSHVGNSPCMIVSEVSGTNQLGSTVEFIFENNKLKFKIDVARAQQQNLMVSKALIDMSSS